MDDNRIKVVNFLREYLNLTIDDVEDCEFKVNGRFTTTAKVKLKPHVRELEIKTRDSV